MSLIFPVSSPNFSLVRQISLSDDAFLVLECGPVAGVQEFYLVWWTRDEDGVWEQCCKFLTIRNRHRWCSKCVAVGQRMGGQVLNYCVGKDKVHHLIVIVENSNVQVVILKFAWNRSLIIHRWWQGVASAFLSDF